jgi:(+)-neomenthol dehydrogenase
MQRIPSEQIRKELGDIETLTEEKVDAVLRRFLHDLKENALEINGWTLMLPAYSISKQTLNAYTRILAKKYPNMCINCVHPGYVKTDLNWNTGIMTLEEGARGSVMLSLLPDGGPTGHYFDRTQVAEFWFRQLILQKATAIYFCFCQQTWEDKKINLEALWFSFL